MGNRLSKITTRTGDAGETGIAGNRRLPKTHPRIAAIGDVDELNSSVGVLRASPGSGELDPLLARIQNELFNLGGELAMPDLALVTAEQVSELERAIETRNAELPPLRDFVLPGGNPAAAAHMCRTICRRAERSLWAVHEAETLRAELPQYLNRLSDLMFVLARGLARSSSDTETQWSRNA